SDAATDLITMAENGPIRMPAAAKATVADVKAAEAKAVSQPPLAEPKQLERPTGIKAVDAKPAMEHVKPATTEHQAPEHTAHDHAPVKH
ncbi:MAG TPA: hypothetical protein VM598_04135, partial [Bdellovibrionota bacterium]|nr:hypothetical protein [Bdellovibrionota bacterium]